MGYAGNSEPQYIVPTAIATKDDITAGDFVKSRDGLEDLDFYIGNEVRQTGLILGGGVLASHSSAGRTLRGNYAPHKLCRLLDSYLICLMSILSVFSCSSG